MILPMIIRCAAICLAATLLLQSAAAAQDTWIVRVRHATSGDIHLGD
jgi:hypothetical protein